MRSTVGKDWPEGRYVVTLSECDALGDAIMALPFFMALRQVDPDACLVHGVSRWSKLSLLSEIFDIPPVVDEIVGDLGCFGPIPDPRPLAALPRAHKCFVLRSRWLDVAMVRGVLPANEIYTVVPGYWLSTRRPEPARRPDRVAERGLPVLRAAYGGDHSLENFAPLRPRVDEGPALHGSGPAIGLYLGASPDPRAMSIEQTVVLARGVLERGMRPVLLVGPDELGVVESVLASVPDLRVPLEPDGGSLSLGRLVALASQLDAAIVKDGGLAHVLGAAGVPLVSVVVNPHPPWSATPWVPGKWLPWGSPATLVTSPGFRGRGAHLIEPITMLRALDDLL